VCPSGVAYGRIIEHVKAQVAADPPRGGIARRLRRTLLRQVVARQRVLSLVCAPLRLYANAEAVRRFTERVRLPGPAGRLTDAARSLPHRQGRPYRFAASPADAASTPAVMFRGCIMPELFGNTHRATSRVLERAGYAVQSQAAQGCCGALHAHDGDLEFARTLARRNIDAFEGSDAPIVVNSAGCGAAMKEYGDLLADDDRYAARARRFSARVRDLSEVLPAGRGTLAEAESVAYQDACHLAHAQRIRQQPRSLIGSIEGAEMVETAAADMCCGAAGIYSLVQPEMSAELRSRKAEQFKLHRPGIVVTANPGCQMQYTAAVKEAGIDARVMHLAELLDEARWCAGVTDAEGATRPN